MTYYCILGLQFENEEECKDFLNRLEDPFMGVLDYSVEEQGYEEEDE